MKHITAINVYLTFCTISVDKWQAIIYIVYILYILYVYCNNAYMILIVVKTKN